jgi:hypothetical protein
LPEDAFTLNPSETLIIKPVPVLLTSFVVVIPASALIFTILMVSALALAELT